MVDTVPTPGVPDEESNDQAQGGEGGRARKGDGRTDGIMPADERGAGGGGPIGPKDADEDFHGGQSGAAYHGHGQLGEKDVEGQGNSNSVSEDP